MNPDFHARKFSLFMLVLLILPLIVACGAEATSTPAASSPTSESSKFGDSGFSDRGAGPTNVEPAHPLPSGSGAGSSGAAAAPTSTTAAAGGSSFESFAPTPAGADGFSGAPPAGDGLSYGTYDNARNQPPLTAGEVDDNAQLAAYLEYLGSMRHLRAPRLDVSERLYVQVTDRDQRPVAGARVRILAGQQELFSGRTMSDGRVAFFPRLAGGSEQAQSYLVVAEAAGQRAEGQLDRGSAGRLLALPLTGQQDEPVTLDVVFAIDATGSMSDEIEKLQQTIHDISRRLEQLPGGARVRFGLVAYRDRGEEYVTRSWDLTPSVDRFAANLAEVRAEGGGDTYEAVNDGLADALALPGWQQGEATRHLRLLFLVGDAAPHLDYAGDHYYPDLLAGAVARGVKIFPIGCSGLDDLGEYVFRQYAQLTGGKFVFLTYADGAGGAPGVATRNHVEDFSVANLDDLLVRLIAAEVANQNAGATALPGAFSVSAPVSGQMPAASEPAGWLLRLRPLMAEVQQWGWLILLLVVAFFWRREREKARLASAALASSSPPARTAAGAPVEPLSELTRPLAASGPARARSIRPRRSSAALSRGGAAGRTATLERHHRNTQPLPPPEF